MLRHDLVRLAEPFGRGDVAGVDGVAEDPDGVARRTCSRVASWRSSGPERGRRAPGRKSRSTAEIIGNVSMCIYCLGSDGLLTAAEHPIPESLGNTAET